MAAPRSSLTRSKRFLPLFITQFFGAFNDNLFRQGILMLITFQLAAGLSSSPAVMNNLAVGLFVLPYFLFSALAGQVADKYEKSGQIVWIKVWEIGLMILGAIGFYYSNLPLLIAVLSGLGLQSTFFGPIKYSILPDLVEKDELLSANALVEAGTFVAILLGTLIGGFVMATGEGRSVLSAICIAVAVAGTISGRFVPKTGAAAPDLKITPNIFASTKAQLKTAMTNSVSRRSIIGISWIWLYGSLYIGQMPVIAKYHLGGNETVVTLFMACFTLGIGLGSYLCSRLLKGTISAKLAVPGLMTMFVLGLLLYTIVPEAQDVQTAAAQNFLNTPINWLITAILLLSAVCTGLVIVPLYAILQAHCAREQRSRMIAATNIMNSGFMAGGAIGAAILVSLGLSTPGVLLILGIMNLAFIPSMKALTKQMTP